MGTPTETNDDPPAAAGCQPTRGAADAADAANPGWTSRPLAARALRVAVALAPLPATLATSHLITRLWNRPDTPSGLAVWWLTLLASAVVVSLGVERAGRRVLPLASLLRLSLVFPDHTPSRFRVALRSGNVKALQERLMHMRRSRRPGDAADVASLLLALVTALGDHDRLTRGHCERVRAYASLIGRQMGLSHADRDRLQWAALLHDVGKTAVRAALLNKSEPLTDEEFAEISVHPLAADELIEPLAAWLGPWRLAATQHHERFDGKGYPGKLAGDDISLAARIVAVADSFDVMTTARSYKKPSTPASARQELARCAGAQFDPAVVRAFLEVSLPPMRRRFVPLSWLAQLAYLRSAAESTLTVAAGLSGLAAGFATAVGPAAASTTAPTAAVIAHAGRPAAAASSASSSGSGAGAATSSTVPPVATPPPAHPQAPPVATDPTVVTTELTATVDAIAIVPIPERGGDPPTSSTAATEPVRAADASTTSVAAPATTPAPTGGGVPADATTSPTTNPPATTTTEPEPPPEAITTRCQHVLDSGGAALAGADLTGCNLRGIVFAGTDLSGADLTGADLRGAVISSSTLTGANLTGADLSGVRLDEVGLGQALLTNARLDGVHGDGVDLAGADLRGANLSSANLAHAAFDGADLTNAVASGATLEGARLARARLTGVRFDHVDLAGAVLDGANLANADLAGADLRDASLREAVGTPSSTAGALWSATVCPDGALRDATCF